MKKNNKKGFTLAELLIVVAIIAVLTAIAIPVFTTQLEKSREATDMSNLRAAYAEVMANYLANGASVGAANTESATVATVSARQTQASWQNPANGSLMVRVNGTEGVVPVTATTSPGTWTVSIDTTNSSLVTVNVNG